jgi:hypothetical protein
MERGLLELGRGIEMLLDANLREPSLILTYSAIDIAGWLNCDDPNATVEDSFTAWTDRYLLRARPLNCTALELYGARCGLLHTMTANARLIAEGRGRHVAYAWGGADVNHMQTLIDRRGVEGRLAVVHMRDLYEAWRGGLLLFQQELGTDSPRAARVYGRAGQFFDTFSTEDVGEALRRAGGIPPT